MQRIKKYKVTAYLTEKTYMKLRKLVLKRMAENNSLRGELNKVLVTAIREYLTKFP